MVNVRVSSLSATVRCEGEGGEAGDVENRSPAARSPAAFRVLASVIMPQAKPGGSDTIERVQERGNSLRSLGFQAGRDSG